MGRHIPRFVHPLAQFDRTAYFERVIPVVGGSPFAAQYGALHAVSSGAPGTVNAPNVGAGTEATTKDAFHFGVVSTDGTSFTIAGNGKNINGASSISVSGPAGASATLYYSTALGAWVAFLSGGASVTTPPTYTGKNGSLITYNTSTYTSVLATPTITASLSQKVILNFSCQLTCGGDAGVDMQGRIYADVVGVNIDTFVQTVDSGEKQIVNWQLEVGGDGTGHVYGMAWLEGADEDVSTPIGACRFVAQVVNG